VAGAGDDSRVHVWDGQSGAVLFLVKVSELDNGLSALAVFDYFATLNRWDSTQVPMSVTCSADSLTVVRNLDESTDHCPLMLQFDYGESAATAVVVLYPAAERKRVDGTARIVTGHEDHCIQVWEFPSGVAVRKLNNQHT
jgi:hypothetical protein